MLTEISLSAGVGSLFMSGVQNVVYEYTPVLFVIVISCKQTIDNPVFATLAIFGSVLISITGCVPVVFVVILAI
jgi:hypothetical protein